MGLIKEPKDVDFSTKSEPWSEPELLEFRKIMQDIKEKNNKHKAADGKSHNDKNIVEI
jgi:hypothetical protein